MKTLATEHSLSDPLAPLAEAWEEALAARPQAATPDLAGFRDGLIALAEQAETGGRVGDARSLRRIALLSEVWECLQSDPDRSDAAADVASFCTDALQALARLPRAGSGEGAEPLDWIVEQSNARWSNYLAVVDPALSEIAQDEDASLDGGDAYAQPDEPPTLDTQSLLRLISGHDGPEGQHTPTSRAHSSPGSSAEAAECPAKSPAPEGDPRALARTAALAQSREDAKGEERQEPGERVLEIPPLPARVGLDDEMREAFLADVTELFERIENLVVGLGGPSEEQGAIQELARCFHTLKGAAGSVGFGDLATLVHHLEERLGRVAGRVSEDLKDQLHQVVGYLDGLIGALRRGETAEPAKTATATAPPEDGRGAGPAEHIPQTTGPVAEGLIRVPSGRFDELTDLAGELIVQGRFWISQAEGIAALVGLARAARNRLLASVERLHELGLAQEGRKLPGIATLRSDLAGQLRRLTEQADDLTVLAETAQGAASAMADRADALIRHSHRLWDSFQSLRIIPIRGLFHRLARVVHDAARVEGRRVEVAMLGEETGADRGIQDKAFEPLLHVVRNSVGHGIESSAERSAAGKPAAGRVALEARREGNSLMIAVEDDGKGLDDQAIAAKARLLGWLAPDETPSRERLHSFVFQPGFSTKSQANAISGRGVGMDVVAREVGKLGGMIELTSRPGRGTRVTLRLPSQLALEPALIVRAAGQGFAVPASQIESAQLFEPAPLGAAAAAEQKAPDPPSTLSNAATVVFRERTIPVVFVRETLGIARNTSPPWSKLVVVRAGSELLGLVVDATERTEDLVVKPLGALLAGHPLVSGTSLSVNGELISVLNPRGLEQWRTVREIPEPESVRPAPPRQALEPLSSERATVLVVDDSISVRRGLARQLRGMGLEVHEVSDGMEALGRMRGARYGLVVTDLEMPRLDGFALLAEMKRSALLARIPVVVASTLGDAETRRRVRELGALALLCKPVNPGELARTVEPLLAGVGR
jgi:chemotaxis protein histidine kinase CheA